MSPVRISRLVPGIPDTIQAEWVWQTDALNRPFAQSAVGLAGVNAGEPSQASTLWLHRVDGRQIDQGATIGRLAPGSVVYLQQRDLATSFHQFDVTGQATLEAGSTWRIPVATKGGSPTGTEPENNVPILVVFQIVRTA